MNTTEVPDFHALRQRAMHHLRVWAREIGPRPPTSPALYQAMAYAAQVLQQAGVQVERLYFRVPRYTYWTYFFTFLVASLGNALAAWKGNRKTALLAMLLNLAGAQAFLAQTDFEPNWARWFTPKGMGMNLIARVPPRLGSARNRLVLMAHLDTHKTPWMYHNRRNARVFSWLLSTTFLLFWASAGAHGIHTLLGRSLPRWVQALWPGLQAAAAALTAQAETTPYSPGAHDNASGAALALALGEHLARHPLEETEIWLVFTDCEEVGAYGVDALHRAYGEQLREAVFLNLDMVGMGQPAVQLVDGLVRRHWVHPRLWERVRPVVEKHPHWYVHTQGGAYTDATLLTKHGYQAITITMYLPDHHPAAFFNGYWHQTRDRVAYIEPETLEEVLRMTWTLMQHVLAQPSPTQEESP